MTRRKMSDSNGGGGGGGNSSSSAGATSSTTPSVGGSGGGKAPGASGRGNNSKLLTHQMSSGSLTGVRSTRDRDITNLVPSGTDTTSSPQHFYYSGPPLLTIHRCSSFLFSGGDRFTIASHRCQQMKNK